MKKLVIIAICLLLPVVVFAETIVRDGFEVREFKNLTIHIPNNLEPMQKVPDRIAFVNFEGMQRMIVLSLDKLPETEMSLFETFSRIHSDNTDYENVSIREKYISQWDKIDRMEKYQTKQFLVFLTKGIVDSGTFADCFLVLKGQNEQFGSVSFLDKEGFFLSDEEMDYVIKSIEFE